MKKNNLIVSLLAGAAVLMYLVTFGTSIVRRPLLTDEDKMPLIDVLPSPTKIPEPERALSREYLVGIWQDLGGMASGWSNHYNFYPDGKFQYYVSQMKCDKRTIMKSGGWIVENGKLILTTTKEINLIGGKMVRSTGSCGSKYTLEGASEVVNELKRPVVEVFELALVDMEEFDNHERLDIGKTPFWKFDSDPTGDGEFVR